MPKAGRKTRAAWADLKESWRMIVDIEKEGFKLTENEADRNYDLMKDKLRQADALVKKRRSALRRYLLHKKRGD